MSEAEKKKFAELYAGEEEEEEEETCVEGFSWDEDCDPEHKLGIEHCEFMCPWRRLDAVYEDLKRRRLKRRR